MKKNPLMNGWQKVLYQLRKKWYQLRKNKRILSKQSPIPYWQQEFYYHDFV